MEKTNLLNSYKGARSTLLAIIIFSVVNCFMLLMDLGYTFLYSTITPQLAIIFAKEVFSGFTSVIVIVMFAFIPIVLYLISYLLSNKEWKWMLVSTILFGVDILVFAIFFLTYGFESNIILDIIFEAVIMFSLVSGTIAGKKLNNDFEEEITFNPATEIGEDAEGEKIKVYSYDKQYAKKNKANKTALLVLSFVGLMVLMVIVIVLLIPIFKDNVLLLLAVVYGLLIAYIVWILKLSPFFNAKNYQYFLKDGAICRNTVINKINGPIEILTDLKVESTKEDSYICSFQRSENKRKKLIIPKSYPEIEDILKY
ncbi:MAG TPA: hypothetical protein PLT36_02500 [Erysipelotrichaceae bacterium]|nr:hypothetical protein [Erysipelotrichaceae bacterium]HQA85123.1 hypothetical protein [Erysipelotrichaceae bacterium]